VPENVAATAGNAVVTIRWSASAGAATYNVQRGTASSGPYTTLATPASLTFTDSTVTNSKKYYYVVAAVNAAGQSPDSAEVVATPTAPVTAPTTGVSRPSYNTGTGLFVLNGKLYDSKGVQFVMQGLNRGNVANTVQPGMSNANANTVRINNFYESSDVSLLATDAALDISYDQVVVVTTPYVPGTSTVLSGDTSTADLTTTVNWWIANFTSFSSMQKHLILNIANEWGPAGSSTWQTAYISAVTALRSAGYTCPIMIDSGAYGQDFNDLLDYSSAIFAADPQKNIIFTIHLYGNAGGAISGSPNFLQQLASLSASDGMVFAATEIGSAASLGGATVQQVINASNSAGLGWAAWAWDETNSDGSGDQMTETIGVFTGTPATASTSSQLTPYGQQVVPNFANTAKATDFP
jgi:mannan endo-1,4-beta-mannosidase